MYVYVREDYIMNYMTIINFLIDYCSGEASLAPVIKLATNVVKILQFAIPLALILFGMIDLGKAVVAGKEDEMKKAQGTLIKRFIYAVLIFFVVTLVTFVMSVVGESAKEAGDNNWSSCWSDCWKGDCTK